MGVIALTERRPGRRPLLVAAAIALAVSGAFLFALVVVNFDPAPDRFLVGATLVDGNEVTLFIGDCAGGRLQRMVLAVDETDGREPSANALWVVNAGPGDGLPLRRGGVVEVSVGTAPAGMVETTTLEEALPSGKKLQLSVDTSLQGYGFFFKLADLKRGKIWISEGYKLVDRNGFRSLVDALPDCKSHG